MSDYILARQNGRNVPKEDIIFAISNRAKAAIAAKGKDAVVNATIGALMDDNGDLIVLESVTEAMKRVAPADYAAYAPIGGTPKFKECVQKIAFGKYEPKRFTAAVATPGGTGALRNSISNYSDIGDKILTADWFWGPYKTIAGEIGRSIATFELFTEEGKFNADSLKAKSEEIIAEQESLVVILNTPAHNPTGYSLTLEDWDKVVAIYNELAKTGKTITLVVDAAYIDFAGDEDEYREFLPKLEELADNVMVIVAYSLSKTFTLYGMRCGAMICMAATQEIADEFVKVCEFSSRGSWSNGARLGQEILVKVCEDEELGAKVSAEREYFRNMLIARGQAFSEAAAECGLEIVPFDAGFFISIPCDNPAEIRERLEEQDIFAVALAKGLRISAASVSEEKMRQLPAIIKAAMDK